MNTLIGNYTYGYNMYTSMADPNMNDGVDESQNGWGVYQTNFTGSNPGPILESINGKPIVNLTYTFFRCTSLTTAPTIPANVSDMVATFDGCNALTGTITINTNEITTNMGYETGACTGCFSGVDMSKITLTGEASKDVLNLIGSTGNNYTPIP